MWDGRMDGIYYDDHVDVVQYNILLNVVGLIWESIDDDDVDIVQDNVL